MTYYSHLTVKNKRRKWKGTLASDTFQAFLPYIDPFSCGELWQDKPHWSITNETKAAYRNRWDNPNATEIAKRYHMGKLSARRIDQGIQFDDQYFTCNHGCASSLSLVYLDIDDHLDWQNDKPALTAAIFTFLDSRYIFTNAGRIWLKVDWHDSDFPTFKEVYTKFLDSLRYWAKANKFDSDIDLPKGITTLGRLPLKDWNYTKLEIFKETPHVTVAMLKDWTNKLNKAIKKELTVKSTAAMKSRSDVESKLSIPTPRILSCKSIQQVPFSEEDIASIPDMVKGFRTLAYTCMREAEPHKPKGQNLYALDIQYVLTVLQLSYKYANENHAMPVRRAEAWWNWMVREEHFIRGWDDKKWAAVIRLLADCGVLNKIDNRYWFYADGSKKGKAMQYHIREEYLVKVSERGEASISEVKITFIPKRWRPLLCEVPERQSDPWASSYWREKLDQTLYEAA